MFWILLLNLCSHSVLYRINFKFKMQSSYIMFPFDIFLPSFLILKQHDSKGKSSSNSQHLTTSSNGSNAQRGSEASSKKKKSKKKKKGRSIGSTMINPLFRIQRWDDDCTASSIKKLGAFPMRLAWTTFVVLFMLTSLGLLLNRYVGFWKIYFTTQWWNSSLISALLLILITAIIVTWLYGRHHRYLRC